MNRRPPQAPWGPWLSAYAFGAWAGEWLAKRLFKWGLRTPSRRILLGLGMIGFAVWMLLQWDNGILGVLLAATGGVLLFMSLFGIVIAVQDLRDGRLRSR
jgi:hypothetical protein